MRRRWSAHSHGKRPGRHLRHSIFFALGATIVLSVVVAGIFVHASAGGSNQLRAFEAFTSDRFRAVWDHPERRDDLARSIEAHFRVRLTLRDSKDRVVYGQNGPCERRAHRLEVWSGSQSLGRVEACILSHGWPKSVIFGLSSLVLALWAMSGLIARRLVRPLDDLVKVVRDIGDGRLDARIQLCRHGHRGELAEVAQAVNQMAEKIERQIAGQRELLAAVSHEIRSPLARLRILVELEREASGESPRLGSMDLELVEMDSLVGQLLAQSRLEFQSPELRAHLAVDLAKMVLDRASLLDATLVDAAGGAEVKVDVSLFSRALLNLIDNAQRHGNGLTKLAVRLDGNRVLFEIHDGGPGFSATVLQRAFEPFVRSNQAGGLGLGLSLVQKIVQAHGGVVRLANAAEGGALVVVEVPRHER